MAIAGDGVQWLGAHWGNTAANLYPFSMFGWYWLNSTANDIGVVGLGNASTLGSAAIVTSAGAIRACAVSDSSTFTQPTGATVRTGSWQPGAALFLSASSRTVYDISRAGVTNTTAITASTFTDIDLMAWYAGGLNAILAAGCWVAECAIWTTLLGAAEINSLLQGANPLTVRRDKIFCYFPLRDSVTDFGPCGFNAQPQSTNAITWGNHPPVPPFRQTRSYGFLQGAAVTPVPFSRQRTYLRR